MIQFYKDWLYWGYPLLLIDLLTSLVIKSFIETNEDCNGPLEFNWNVQSVIF